VRLVYWTVTLLVALLLVLFAVSNRAAVEVTFWPLPMALAAPLWLVVLLALLVGFWLGQVASWLAARRWRRDARQRRRRVEALERELAATQAQLRPAAPPGPGRLLVPGAPRD
jgi:uncharacterized integral membrane protein